MNHDRVADWSGRLQLRPGGALPTIGSTRRELAPLLARGRPARQLPELLGSVFALCGGAHRVAARHAVAAALGHPGDDDRPTLQRLLQTDTLREHLRRLWLDLPGLTPALPRPDAAVLGMPDAPTAAAIPAAPGARADRGAVTAARAWVEHHVLGQRVVDWLAMWSDDPSSCIERWSSTATTWPARWLQAVRRLDVGPSQPGLPLQVHASPHELRRLAATLRREAGFALAPTWRGRTAETGCWTRAADPLGRAAPPGPAGLTRRGAARIAEVARLVATGGDAWLSQGGLVLDAGEGLGWCEMARGLLIHWVRLDGEGRVTDCRIVAPTEWNFHPFGPVARALARLNPDVDDTRVRLLAGAYDPCVAVTVDRLARQPRERAHA